MKADSSSALEPQTPSPSWSLGGSAGFFHSSLYCHINFLHSIADAGCYGDQEGAVSSNYALIELAQC